MSVPSRRKLFERPRAPFIEKIPNEPGESVIWSGEPETPGVRKISFWKSRPFSGRSFACAGVNGVPRVAAVVSACRHDPPQTPTTDTASPGFSAAATRHSAATSTAAVEGDRGLQTSLQYL